MRFNFPTEEKRFASGDHPQRSKMKCKIMQTLSLWRALIYFICTHARRVVLRASQGMEAHPIIYYIYICGDEHKRVKRISFIYSLIAPNMLVPGSESTQIIDVRHRMEI